VLAAAADLERNFESIIGKWVLKGTIWREIILIISFRKE
jgi:hypothetical protein